MCPSLQVSRELTNDGVGIQVEILEELLETPEAADAALETALGTVILSVLQSAHTRSVNTW